MSKQASPATIGAFVVAAVGLVLCAIVVLAGGRLFHKSTHMIVYFDGSVNGLKVGAAVKFRGIDIGTVSDIRINMSGVMRDAEHVHIPVVLDIDTRRLSAEGVAVTDLHDPARVRALVDEGLRASLESESLLTGMRYVALDVKPKTQAHLVNNPRVKYPEIPSVPSAQDEIPDRVNQVLGNLAEVDLATLTRSLTDTVDEAHRLLASPGLVRGVNRLDELTTDLDKTIVGLQPGVRSLGPVATEWQDAAKSASRLVAPDGKLAASFDATLDELRQAARSLRRLADQLSRDPGSLVRGGRP